MSTVYIQTESGITRLDSVHTPDYAGRSDCVINPATVPEDMGSMRILNGEFATLTKAQQTVKLEAAKSSKLTDLAAKRWEAVQAGVEINGVTVATDSDSQTALIGAAFGAFVKMIGSSLPAAAEPLVKLIPDESGWKGKGGKWADLSITDTLGVAVTVRAHVQALFDEERGLAEKVAACSSVAEVEAITW